MENFKPKDVIAGLLITLCMVGKIWYGLNGTLTMILLAITGYYFGREYLDKKK